MPAPDLDALALLAGDAQAFLEKSWASRVHLHHTAPGSLADRLRIGDVDHLLTSTALRTPALRVARDGNVLPASAYTRHATLAGQPLTGLVDGRKVLDLFEAGASLVLQGLHRYWPPLAELVRSLELELGHPCQANAYLTPPGSQGFAVHSDTHDVFVFQTHGTKEWEVHDGDEVRSLLLEPGLSMYLPTGTPHAARAQDTASLHVTIGINQASTRSLLSRVTERLLQDPKYDGRLPAGYPERPELLAAQLGQQLRQLAADLESADAGRLARDESDHFLTGRFPLLGGGLLDRLRLEDITDTTPLARRGTSPCSLREEGGRLIVLIGDRSLTMPARVRPAMEYVARVPGLTPGELPGLDPESRLVLVRRLVREGLLQVAG